MYAAKTGKWKHATHKLLEQDSDGQSVWEIGGLSACIPGTHSKVNSTRKYI